MTSNQRPITDDVPGTVIAGLVDEFGHCAALVCSLDVAGWTSPTICAGWEVRHVFGHVIGQLGDVMTGRGGTRTADEQARAADQLDRMEAVAEMNSHCAGLANASALLESLWAAPSPLPGATVGSALRVLWHDTWTHANDIRAAVGVPIRRGPGMISSLAVVTDRLSERCWPGDVQRSADAQTVTVRTATGRIGHASTPRFLLAATGRASLPFDAHDPGLDIYAPHTLPTPRSARSKEHHD